MRKSSYIYLLIALAPMVLVIFVVTRNFLTKKVDSPVLFTALSKDPNEIIDSPVAKEYPSLAKDSIYLADTQDPKAMGYTGQDKVAVNSKREIFVVYRAKGQETYEIFVSKIKDNKMIWNKQITNSGNKIQRVPSIAIDSNDKIHLVWYGLTSNAAEGRQIKYTSSSDNGETWKEEVIPSLVEGFDGNDYWQEHPQILVNGNNLYIVWEGKDRLHERQQIKFVRSTDGGNTWSQWKNVRDNPNNTQSRPYLILDSNNNLNLFMYSSRDNNSQQIWHATSSNRGNTWTSWKKVSEGLDDSRHVSATLTNKGIFLTWRSLSGFRSRIYFSVFSEGSWSTPQLVSESNDYQFFPVIGTNKNNDIAVTWVENSDESEFPRDDPENAKGYVAFYNSSNNKFENKTLIDENVYYPHLPAKNNFDNNFYIGYEKGEDKKFEIKLLTTNKK